MTVSVWQQPTDPLEAEHDDVVIGAGIVGCYAATLLVQRGRDVALVDAQFPAAGASGRNAGFVLTAQRENYPDLIARIGRASARETLHMVRDNVHRMRDLAAEHGVPVREGAVHLAETRAEARLLEHWARELTADGIPVEFSHIDPYHVGFAASMQIEDDFIIQPARLTERLAATSGATLYDQNEVFGLASDGAQLVVQGRRARLRCRRVYVATNGHAGALHAYLRRIVRPVRGQISTTTPVGPIMPIGGLTEHHYFHQLADNRLLIGGARAYFEAQEDTTEDAVTPNLHANLSAYLRRWFPDVVFEVERQWSGIHGFTADQRAAVGRIPGDPRIAFAVGFSGHGNSIGLLAAERMVELVLDGRDPGPLSAARFG